MVLALLAATVGLVGAAWMWGRSQHEATSGNLSNLNAKSPAKQSSPPDQHLVSGGSMAPTLRGPSCHARCGACQLDWVVDLATHSMPRHRRLCSHCGGVLEVDCEVRHDDVVKIRKLDPMKLPGRGELVAVRGDDRPSYVKRVIGFPGETIDVAPDGVHLTINRRRVEDVLVEEIGIDNMPSFLVDHDASRKESRWSAEASWRRDDRRRWQVVDAPHTWLVYHHQSVYDQNRPSPVWDDYQYNVTSVRKLFPVDRLILSGNIESAAAKAIDVAFWTSHGSLLVTVPLAGNQRFTTSCYRGIAADGLPVGPQRPIAIRAQGDSLTISSLAIKRLVEYRLRRRDDRKQYPLPISYGQLFLLGDNVPVSVDSRNTGLVPLENILGLATRR